LFGTNTFHLTYLKGKRRVYGPLLSKFQRNSLLCCDITAARVCGVVVGGRGAGDAGGGARWSIRINKIDAGN